MTSPPPPKLVSAVDESGTVLCLYNRDAKADSWQAIPPKKTTRSYAKAVLDVFLPAGYPHTVTPDYTPYQIYDSLQAFSSTIAGLLSSRAVLQGFGVGDSSSSATAAVLLTVLQESTGRLATILFAHRFGQAIEPECKRYRFLADVLNDGALALDVLTPAILSSSLSFSFFSTSTSASTATSIDQHYYARALALCASGILRALCGVAAGAAKASLSAHFARGGGHGGGNLAELNAKDGSQETVISLLGMLAGSVFVRAVTGTYAVWLSTAVLVAVHLATNYAAVRAVELRSLNRQRAQLVLRHYRDTGGRVLVPKQAARRERILMWRSPRDALGLGVSNGGGGGGKIAFARSHPRTDEIGAADLWRHREDPYVIVPGGRGGRTSGGRTIFMKEGATPRDTLAAWFEALLMCGDGEATRTTTTTTATEEKSQGYDGKEELLNDEFWKALASAGWDLDAGALETGPAVRIRVE
ncbi:hypothetical protein SLS62_009065 [Diatrype stigma]|uniref:Protein root UVB sensitive/RUS domain-containing protein n=1 Tax=Diatrype stigma TaxID=117547 RepID=A0AAN9UGU8_9PEZI